MQRAHDVQKRVPRNRWPRHAAPHQAAIPSADAPSDALTALARALREAEGREPTLEVGAQESLTTAGLPTDPERGFLVTLRAEGAEARLWISRRRAKLRCSVKSPAGISSQVEDRVPLALEPRPRLGALELPSLPHLAALLLELMRRRLEDIEIPASALEVGLQPGARPAADQPIRPAWPRSSA